MSWLELVRSFYQDDARNRCIDQVEVEDEEVEDWKDGIPLV